VFECHENDDYNQRAFLPVLTEDSYQRDGKTVEEFRLQVIYLNVTTATVKEIGADGEEYYVCRFDPTSNVRLEPRKASDQR
jgi:hypothetical protein